MPERICPKCGTIRQVRKIYWGTSDVCSKCWRKAVEPAATEVEARKRYTRRKHRGYGDLVWPDFDVIKERFENDCLSFTDIATEIGVTRERVRQVYWEYFSKIIPRRPDGMARRVICTRKKHAKKVVDSFLTRSSLAVIQARAQMLGWLRVNPARITRERSVRNSRFLELNGKLCQLHIRTVPNKYVGQWSFPVNTSTKVRVQFHLLQAGVGPEAQVFVVPETFIPTHKKLVALYAPLDFKRKGIGAPIKHDILPFLEAWHLLK